MGLRKRGLIIYIYRDEHIAPRWSGEDLADKAPVLYRMTGLFGEMSIRFHDINPSDSPLESLKKTSASRATIQNHNYKLSRSALTGKQRFERQGESRLASRRF